MVTHQALWSMGFPRQEYRSGLPGPDPPGDLPDPGIEPASPATSVLQVDSLSLSHLGSLYHLLPTYIVHRTVHGNFLREENKL